jgi:RNA polymerase sigma-70 factor (ECF subfamily)
MAADPPDRFDLNALYRGACQGDRVAEQRLMQHLGVSFGLFAQQRIWNEQDAEEVVQDALVTILEKYRSLTIDTSFGGWAYRVLQNKIMDHVKKKTTRRRLDEEHRQGHENQSEAANDDIRTRLIGCFRKIHRVNRRHARILNLHYQGYATPEICARLRLTESNFYVLLSRARRALAACLGKGDEAT